jgi:hypothetical protein
LSDTGALGFSAAASLAFRLRLRIKNSVAAAAATTKKMTTLMAMIAPSDGASCCGDGEDEAAGEIVGAVV